MGAQTDARNDERRVAVEIADALRELEALRARERALRRETAEARLLLAEVRASWMWRALEAYRRARMRKDDWLDRVGLSAGLRGLARAVRPVPRAVRRQPIGVNVAGYLSTESGMGEAARASVRSLQAAGVPVALNNVESFLRQQDATFSSFQSDNPHPVNLVHLNADNMAWFARRQGRRYFRRRYTIGYWFWELSTFRPEWRSGFRYVDEVWVASEFTRACLAACTRLPVLCMPLPVVLPEPSPLSRDDFGLPRDAFVFLFTFDASSQMERKNPLGAIHAFRQAALPFDQAVLVLKFTNPEYDPREVRRLREAADGLHVAFIDRYLTRRDLLALMTAADAYISLHRSEGFGLTIAEAMSLGKPALATAYSGNLDFMTPENSYLIDYRLVSLARDYGPYPAGAVWADPDLGHAAALVRHVATHPDEARCRGARAAADLRGSRDPRVTGARVERRLDALRQGHRFPGRPSADTSTLTR